jgi:hypothetical protein
METDMKKNKIGDDRLNDWLIGLGMANAILFLFIGDKFLSAIRGFLEVFGE